MHLANLYRTYNPAPSEREKPGGTGLDETAGLNAV